jgi:hypothetical protein
LHLLDLAVDSTGAWPTRAGGTYALFTGPHSITQRWARRITETPPDLDGLCYNSHRTADRVRQPWLLRTQKQRLRRQAHP